MDGRDLRAVDYSRLMKKVEAFVNAVDSEDDLSTRIHHAAASIVTAFRDELGILGGRLYHWTGQDYLLEATFPLAKPVAGLRVPANYRPVERVLEEGALYMAHDDPALDPELEAILGTGHFAVIEVADEEYLIAFDVSSDRPDPDSIIVSLGILRHAINQKIQRERVAGMIDEARKIQASILPKRPPRVGGYQVSGHSVPMEKVGGDFYDFIPITEKSLGVAIATSRATACRRPSRCATSTPVCAWAWRVTSRSCARSSVSTGSSTRAP